MGSCWLRVRPTRPPAHGRRRNGSPGRARHAPQPSRWDDCGRGSRNRGPRSNRHICCHRHPISPDLARARRRSGVDRSCDCHARARWASAPSPWPQVPLTRGSGTDRSRSRSRSATCWRTSCIPLESTAATITPCRSLCTVSRGTRWGGLDAAAGKPKPIALKGRLGLLVRPEVLVHQLLIRPRAHGRESRAPNREGFSLANRKQRLQYENSLQ